MIGICDIIIILFLILGAIVGFKRGVIKSATMFIGSILVLFLAFYLKNPVSKLMYTYLPFFQIKGIFEGVEILNILIYESVAFLLVYVLLMVVLKVIIKITGVFETILNFTILLGIPSKILGAIFGLFEQYIFIFIALFVLSKISFTAPYINDSLLGKKIMSSSPGISNITEKYYESLEELYSLKDKYKEGENGEYNKEALRILLKYNIINEDTVRDLIQRGKLNKENLDVIEGEKNND